MKISSKYVLRNILGQNIVEPGDIILNESGAFLWNQLREEKKQGRSHLCFAGRI